MKTRYSSSKLAVAFHFFRVMTFALQSISLYHYFFSDFAAGIGRKCIFDWSFAIPLRLVADTF